MTKQQQAICQHNQSAFCPILPGDMVAVALEMLGKNPIYGVRVHKAKPNYNIEWYFSAANFLKALIFINRFTQNPWRNIWLYILLNNCQWSNNS